MKFEGQRRKSKFNVTEEKMSPIRLKAIKNEIGKTSSDNDQKADLKWKLQVSNTSREVIGATSSEDFSTSEFESAEFEVLDSAEK